MYNRQPTNLEDFINQVQNRVGPSLVGSKDSEHMALLYENLFTMCGGLPHAVTESDIAVADSCAEYLKQNCPR